MDLQQTKGKEHRRGACRRPARLSDHLAPTTRSIPVSLGSVICSSSCWNRAARRRRYCSVHSRRPGRTSSAGNSESIALPPSSGPPNAIGVALPASASVAALRGARTRLPRIRRISTVRSSPASFAAGPAPRSPGSVAVPVAPASSISSAGATVRSVSSSDRRGRFCLGHSIDLPTLFSRAIDSGKVSGKVCQEKCVRKRVSGEVCQEKCVGKSVWGKVCWEKLCRKKCVCVVESCVGRSCVGRSCVGRSCVGLSCVGKIVSREKLCAHALAGKP
ncbi:MAG: hypothetical protein BJ554DRAFT_6131 [Olpidium bornovanus]|uniref:Uncharacterized protein n=1 Tax=Olpidium bornovanus TaxID=278681 RepID=A0A8H7ZZ39_9FUNG|nr:MAG: hypothetical protein BJ554DRAFT_6131 [Olpidium bornovanus]